MNLKTVLKNISVNLKQLRAEREITQMQISLDLPMERRSYQKLENNQNKDIKLSTLIKIVDYFEITFSELFRARE